MWARLRVLFWRKFESRRNFELTTYIFIKATLQVDQFVKKVFDVFSDYGVMMLLVWNIVRLQGLSIVYGHKVAAQTLHPPMV